MAFQLALVEKFVKEIGKELSYSVEDMKEFGLKIREDSNDWASSDDGSAGFIMWEGGPFQWTYGILVSIDGYFFEPVNSWMGAIYPI